MAPSSVRAARRRCTTAPKAAQRLDRTLTRDEGRDHHAALDVALKTLREATPDLHRRPRSAIASSTAAQTYAAPARINEAVFAALKALEPLAPLHQPHNLAGVEAARSPVPGCAADRLLRHRVPLPRR